MKDFIEVPASRSSLLRRKPIYGLGINDADYMIEVDGVRCPFYSKWKNMLTRCYCEKYQKRQPTYVGCSVSNEWLTLSSFKKWMSSQEWVGMHLDKDLIKYGNKVYSPELCVLVPQSLNSLLLSGRNSQYPQGVYLYTNSDRFKAQCNVNGIMKHLGYFSTQEQASKAYRLFKSNHIKETAQQYKSNKRLYNGLINHANLILSGGQ